MKAQLTILGVTLELEAKNEKELWQKVAFYQSLPTVCPIDDTPTRFGFRSPDGNDYYEVCNTNPNYYITFHIGQNKEGGTLYPSGEWSWWDWKNKEKLVLATYTTLTADGQAMRKHILSGDTTPEAKPEPQQTSVAPAAGGKPNREKMKVFHALGNALSAHGGDNWNEKRDEMVRNIGKKRKPAVQIESANDLTDAELDSLIVKMEQRLREFVYELADALNVDEDSYLAILNQYKVDSPEELNGVALTKLYKEVSEWDG